MNKLIYDLQMLMDEWVRALPLITYEEMEAYVDKREQLISQMKLISLSDADREKYAQTIQRLLQCDTLILAKMNQLKDDATQGSNKINTGRIQRNAYEGSYIPDSVFFDKKE